MPSWSAARDGDVGRPPQQLDIGMAADHAGRGARGIHEDAVEGHADPTSPRAPGRPRPPGSRCAAGVRGSRGRGRGARSSMSTATSSARSGVRSSSAPSCRRGRRRHPARACRAAHRAAGRRAERPRPAPRPALPETRQRRHRHRLIELDGSRRPRKRRAGDARRGELRDVVRDADRATYLRAGPWVDARCWPRVWIRTGSGHAAWSSSTSHCGCAVRVARSLIRARQKSVLFPREATQDGIDEPGGAFLAAGCARHRLPRPRSNAADFASTRSGERGRQQRSDFAGTSFSGRSSN